MSTADTGTQERSRNHCREHPEHISSMVTVGKIAERGNKMMKNIVASSAQEEIKQNIHFFNLKKNMTEDRV